MRIFKSGVIQGLSVGCCLYFRTGKNLSIPKSNSELNASSFSLQLGNVSKKDQFIVESHLPKLTFILSLIVLLRACLYDPTYPGLNEALNDFEVLK